MRIAVIGAGNVGSTLGAAWMRSGHNVVYGVRDPGGARARELEDAGSPVTTLEDAAAGAEVVALCVPWRAAEAALRACGDLAGKILIDTTNPLKPDLSGLAVEQGSSGAEEIAGSVAGAHVYKAFNTAGFNIMADPTLDGRRAVMFICGDDEAHKPQVMRLVEDVGFEAVDAGDLSIARLLEPLALLWIDLAMRMETGRDFAFGLLRR